MNYIVKGLFFIGCHELSSRGNNEWGLSVNKGVVLDMSRLLLEYSHVVSAYSNNTLGSACKVISSKI